MALFTTSLPPKPRWRNVVLLTLVGAGFATAVVACGSGADSSSDAGASADGPSTGGSSAAGSGAGSKTGGSGKSGSGTAGSGTAGSGTAGGAGSGWGTGGGAGKGWGAGGGGGSSAAGASSGGAGGEAGGPQSWQTTGETPFAKVSLGGGKTLELAKLNVVTHVEGLRARTLVDHVYYNPYAQQTEGTFYYSLPPEASVAYFAMYTGIGTTEVPELYGPMDGLSMLDPDAKWKLAPDALAEAADKAIWSNLKPARIVRSVEATIAYEEIAIKKVDPALVEEVAPGSFTARVFPIPAKGYNRVLIAYEQTLPRIGDGFEVKFPVPKGKIPELTYTLAATRDQVASASSIGTMPLTASETAEHLAFSTSLSGDSAGGTLAVHLSRASAEPEIDAVSGKDPGTGESYLYARVAPQLPELQTPDGGNEHGVFLLDTSLSEHPDQFNVDVVLMNAILEASPKMKSFKVMTFDTSARWLEGAWIPNTPEGRAGVKAKLDQVLLEGSTDVASALRLLAKPTADLAGIADLDVFLLSDGVVTWGDGGAEAMAKELRDTAPFSARFFAYRTGIAAENLELYAALTRRGATFNCFSMADVPACAKAHQASGLLVQSVSVESDEGGPAVDNVLVQGRQAMLFPGATLTLAGRVTKAGPAKVRVKGFSAKGPMELSFPVDVTPKGALAPRAWAEIAVHQLVQTGDASLEGIAMALSQRYRVASKLGSFLMLETEQMYQQWNLQDETAKFSGQTIASLVEASFAKLGGIVSSWDRLKTLVGKFSQWNRLQTVDGGQLLAKIEAATNEVERELPVSTLDTPLVTKAEVPAAFVAGISSDPTVLFPWIEEGERRRKDGKPGAGIRALTTLVETNPGNAQVERLVGYRLVGWGEEPSAAHLFFHVLERRPFEPQAYRDLANVLQKTRPAVAMAMYEAVIAGQWETKHQMLVPVVKEEYALFVDRFQKQNPQHPLAGYLAQRKAQLGLTSPTGDLRVTITWNTDDTDIDLWVTDPYGEKCFYSHKMLSSGGQLLADLTQGYGPERFEAKKAVPGTYKVEAHYFGKSANALYVNTFVTASVMTKIGTPEETVTHYNLPLKLVNDVGLVTTVGFK